MSRAIYVERWFTTFVGDNRPMMVDQRRYDLISRYRPDILDSFSVSPKLPYEPKRLHVATQPRNRHERRKAAKGVS
jgi:hypothetical protein